MTALNPSLTTAAPAAPAPTPRGRPPNAQPPAVAPLDALGQAADQAVSARLEASEKEVKRLKAECADQAATIARLEERLKASSLGADLLDAVVDAFRRANSVAHAMGCASPS